MSQQNVETAKKLYEAFGQGDIPAVLGGFDANIVWAEPAGSLLPGEFHGPQGVLENFLMKIPATYGQLGIITKDFIDGGDRVVVLGEYQVAGKDGQAVSAPFAHIWNLKDGKFSRYEDYTDTALIAGAVR
jgi:ketosteroid isomerase-like protein